MYSGFTYEAVPLKDIALDDRNPRIVTQSKLKNEDEILFYLFEHEDLATFIKKIAVEGKNKGAERPYVVKTGTQYVVIEGNTRVAAYKVLTGILAPPPEYAASVPNISKSLRESLLKVDCTIAPNRDALLPIMANSHFGLGDKSKWGYLGSRKAVFDEWLSGKTIAQLAKAFDRTAGQIKDLILEYQLYLEALNLPWTQPERDVLLNPSVEFNPPVRFLQTKGHKSKVGISYDKAALNVVFDTPDAKDKFKHLLKKLVINPEQGLGATASYDDVFSGYGGTVQSGGPGAGTSSGGSGTQGGAGATGGSGSTSGLGSGGPGAGAGAGAGAGSSTTGTKGSKPKAHALFGYPVSVKNGLLTQLMKEASEINVKRMPAAATFLLRNVVEALLKHIIHDQKANPASKALDLEGALNLCASSGVTLAPEDKKVLKEFHKSHLAYLNLGAHGNVIPNGDRTFAARDSIDQFVKKHI